MRRWELRVSLDEDDSRPLAARIAEAITSDIRRGRLAPSAPLPSSRELAQSLGVHRNTVIAAYDTLRAEGWIETERARLTRVASALPERDPRPISKTAAIREAIPARPAFALSEGPPLIDSTIPRGVIALFGGMPELSMFPVEAYARAHRRALRSRRATLLEYGSPLGHAALRRAVAEMVSSRRALAASADNVLVTRGSQQALDLIARALLGPGTTIAVEAMGYAPAWQAFSQSGAHIEPIGVDEHGIDVDALARLCEQRPVRAVYVTPHHQYPTTVTLSASRRMKLLALARAQRMAIIEDDYDHEFHYEGRPVLPLASADGDGVVVYIATLSKLLAPGLRTGFVVGPRALIENLAARRRYVDRQGDLVMEAALAELIDDGELARHARRARTMYLERRDTLSRALLAHAGDRLRFDRTRGGMALWAKIEGTRKGCDALCALAHERGVLLQPTRAMCFDGRDRPWVRLGFAGQTPAQLREAARRIAQALDAL